MPSFRLRGLTAVAAVPAAGAPARTVPSIIRSIDKSFSKVRVSVGDWARAEDDFLSAFFNSMLAAPADIPNPVPGQAAIAGNTDAAKGTLAERTKLARRISKHTVGKSFEQCQPRLRECNNRLTALKDLTNRYREKGIQNEKLPQSVIALVEAEERHKQTNHGADPRVAVALQGHRDAVIHDFKPAAALDIQKQIDQCKKELQEAGTAIVRSVTHGEMNKYVSDEAYQEYEVSIQEALAELKTMQDELDALRGRLDPLALVDVRVGLRDERRANSPKAQAKAFACSWKGVASGVISIAATIGLGVANAYDKDVSSLLLNSAVGTVGVYALGAVAGAVLIGGTIAAIGWVLSDDKL